MDEDTTDAAWAAKELEEREQFEAELERHRKLNRDFNDWVTEQGFKRKHT